MSWTPAARAAAIHILAVGLLVEAGDVVGDGAIEEFDVLRQIADVLAEALRAPLIECGTVQADRARASGQTPTRARARLDFPAALGPITATAFTGLEFEGPRSRERRAVEPGMATVMFSVLSEDFGGGSSIWSVSRRMAEKTPSTRVWAAWRAATKPFQFAMAISIGA